MADVKDLAEYAKSVIAMQQERIAELEAALKAVHPPHPQPELCSACKLLNRNSR